MTDSQAPQVDGSAAPVAESLTATVPLRALTFDLPHSAGWFAERDWRRVPLLVQQVHQPVDIQLRVQGSYRVCGSVQLSSLQWRDAHGTCLARVQTNRAGIWKTEWEAELPTAQAGLNATEHVFEFELDSNTEDGGEEELTLRFICIPRAARWRPAVGEVLWRNVRFELGNGEPKRATETQAAPLLSDDSAGPLISVVMPVCDPEPELLRTTVASVFEQTYSNWELAITDDCSTDPVVLGMLDKLESENPGKVKIHRNAVRSGISTATNTAIEISTGSHVALLDHDDLLPAEALRFCAEAIVRDDPDLVYTNDEVLMGAGQVSTSYKPGWSPDMLRSIMYTGHLCVYRRSELQAVNGLRTQLDGSQDFDLALRVIERGAKVVHVPEVLYSWRAHAGSMAGNPHSKPLAYPRALKAINEHVQRTELGGEVVYGRARGHYHHVPAWPEGQGISLVIALPELDDAQLQAVKLAIPTWFEDDVSPSQLVLSVPLGRAEEVMAAVADLVPDACDLKVVSPGDDSKAATPALLLNVGIAACSQEVIALLDRPAVRLSACLLRSFGGFALQDGVHAAGLRIISAAGNVESAGVALRDGVPNRLFSGARGFDHGPAGIGRHTRAVTAVDGFLVTTKQAIENAGGFDSQAGDLGLIDYCLRGLEHQQRTVFLGDFVIGRPHGSTASAASVNQYARLSEQWAERFTETLTPLRLTEGTTTPGLPEFARP